MTTTIDSNAQIIRTRSAKRSATFESNVRPLRDNRERISIRRSNEVQFVVRMNFNSSLNPCVDRIFREQGEGSKATNDETIDGEKLIFDFPFVSCLSTKSWERSSFSSLSPLSEKYESIRENSVALSKTKRLPPSFPRVKFSPIRGKVSV